MDRRRFLLTLLLGAVGTPLVAEAQQAERVYRIGYLSPNTTSSAPNLLPAFRRGLSELGWVEGKNITIDYRFAEGQYDRLPHLVAELIQLKAEILVAVATPTAAIVKKATSRIPIVGITLGDPVRLGLIASLARPGGNVTGLAYSVGVQTIVKALEPLREAVPRVRRVAILSNPANPYHVFAVGEMKRAAASLGVQLQFLEATGPAQFERAFNEMAKQRAGALMVVPDSMFQFHRTRLAELAARGRLPAAYGVREYVEAGGLMSYGPDLPEIWKRAATYVDKILRGTNPAELPVEQPTKFELVINLKTATALGLMIPPALLARADQVIE